MSDPSLPPSAPTDRGLRRRRRRTAPEGVTPSRRIELPIVLRALTVLRTAELTPHMRRITLTGAQLGAFRSAPPRAPDRPEDAGGFDVPAFTSPAADDYVKIFLPEPGHPPVLPEQHDGHLHWPRRPAPLARAYTVRRFDAAAGELDLDFVLHDHGVAGRWARDARPGDTVHLGGPKAAVLPPVGARRWLLAGDETALPAIGRFLGDHPATQIVAFALVDGPQEEQDLPGVHWVHREAARPDHRVLADAVRAAAADAPELGDGHTWLWAAGEASLVRELRGVAAELGVPRGLLDAYGYWRGDSARSPLGRLRVLQEQTAEVLDARRR